MPTFDSLSLRRALGSFATGVTVVTAQNAAGEKVGVTANSFNSVSLDPPLVLWSLAKKSSSYAVFKSAGYFCIHILSAEQMALSNHFAKSAANKFADIAYTLGLGNSPKLADCSATFECKLWQTIDAGDHYIFIGEVLAVDYAQRSSLLFHQGSYCLSIAHPDNITTTSNNESQQAPLHDNIFYLLTQAASFYEQHYVPKQMQMGEGFRTGEARLLLILKSGHTRTLASLTREMNMPVKSIENTIQFLLDRHYIAQDNAFLSLTAKGEAKAQALDALAKDYEARFLAPLEAKEKRQFKTLLSKLIRPQDDA